MRTSFGEFVLDQDGRQLFRSGVPVHVTPKAYALVCYLSARPGRAVSKSELLEHLWPGVFVTEAALTTVVKELRHALGDRASAPIYVRGVRGFGYAFSATASASDALSPDRVAAPDPPSRPAHEFRVIWQDREVALAPGANVLGRTHEAAVWVDDPSVSRRHAVIRVGEDRATIEDCESKNGTFVDGERVAGPRPLEPGETFWLGQASLTLVHYVSEQTTNSADEAAAQLPEWRASPAAESASTSRPRT